MSEEYRQVVAKVTAFTDAVESRRAEAFACARGCSACCHTYLSVSEVEASALRESLGQLPPAERALVAERGERELARESTGAGAARCALLDEQGACVAYDARPLICRTQGHALLYPSGFVPAAAVRTRTDKGEVTHCPLNFRAAAPAAADTLDAGRVDQLLALVNRRFSNAHGVPSDARTAIAQIARDVAVLASATPDDEVG